MQRRGYGNDELCKSAFYIALQYNVRYRQCEIGKTTIGWKGTASQNGRPTFETVKKVTAAERGLSLGVLFLVLNNYKRFMPLLFFLVTLTMTF